MAWRERSIGNIQFIGVIQALSVKSNHFAAQPTPHPGLLLSFPFHPSRSPTHLLCRIPSLRAELVSGLLCHGTQKSPSLLFSLSYFLSSLALWARRAWGCPGWVGAVLSGRFGVWGGETTHICRTISLPLQDVVGTSPRAHICFALTSGPTLSCISRRIMTSRFCRKRVFLQFVFCLFFQSGTYF